MGDWLPWVSAVGVLVTLFGLAAGAAGFFRATATRATVEIQQQTIVAMQQSIGQLEKDNATILAKNSTLTAENEVLRSLGPVWKADIERVELSIETHHRQVVEDRALDRVTHEARFDKIEHQLTQVLGMLNDRRQS